VKVFNGFPLRTRQNNLLKQPIEINSVLGARSQQKSQIMASSTPLPGPTDQYLTMDQREYRPFFKIEKHGQRFSLHLAGSPHSAKTPIVKDILNNKRTNLFHSTSQNIKIS
jgi:hypothetical protein